MSNPDILFRGIPRGPTRGYTAEAIVTVGPSRIVIPCVGSFALAETAVQGSIHPNKILGGDISLYSTALGHAIMDKDFELEVDEEFKPYVSAFMDTPVRKAASVLFVARVLQYRKKKQNQLQADIQRELLYNASEYLKQLASDIQILASSLAGMTYVARDLWLTLEQCLDDDSAMVLLNPPRYSGGYDRMFAGVNEVFKWNKPPVAQFTEKDYSRLMERCASARALVFVYYATDGEDPAPSWGATWRSVFADRPGNKAIASINWIIANRDPIPGAVSRTKLNEGKAKFPLASDSDLVAGSSIVAVKLEKTTGEYYRDLFVHKIGSVNPEAYVAILINGKLLAVCGLHLKDLHVGRTIAKGDKKYSKIATIVFAFTTPTVQPRAHKLTLMSLVSDWFWSDVLSAEAWFMFNGPPNWITTVMLTPHPENKTARGVLNLVDREPQPDGTFKLRYVGEMQKRDRESMIAAWAKQFVKDNK